MANKEIVKEYVIALDLGKWETKAIGRCKEETKEDIKRVKFRTKMLELTNTSIEVGENSFHLIFNDKNIIVGEQGQEIEDNYLTSKSSELHKYCAYVAISKFLEPNTKSKIQIILACPLPVVKIKEAKEKYKEMIQSNGSIKINVDGEAFEFEITDIMVKAEDSCTIYMDELSEERELGIIGFGGLNMNFLLYKNKEFIYKKAWEHGAIKLEKYIAEDLSIYKDGNIVSEHIAKNALHDGYITYQGTVDEKSIDVINDSKKRFIADAKKLILQDGYDIDNLKKLAFIGGTTTQLKNIIAEKYHHAKTFENTQWISIEGLYKVAAKKYMK